MRRVEGLRGRAKRVKGHRSRVRRVEELRGRVRRVECRLQPHPCSLFRQVSGCYYYIQTVLVRTCQQHQQGHKVPTRPYLSEVLQCHSPGVFTHLLHCCPSQTGLLFLSLGPPSLHSGLLPGVCPEICLPCNHQAMEM